MCGAITPLPLMPSRCVEREKYFIALVFVTAFTEANKAWVVI